MSDDSRKLEFNELVHRITIGEVILFIGAGYSISAGGPSGKELSKHLLTKHPDIDPMSNDLLDICQAIEESPKGRDSLVRTMRDKLSKLTANESHLTLSSYYWPVIFTTNYDRVIENAYQGNPRSAHLRVRYLKTPTIIKPNKSETYLFKLMGDVDTENPEESMILTRSDYNLNLSYRLRVLEFLKELLSEWTFLYIGYSFRDLLLTDRYQLINSVFPRNKLPYGYALMPGIEYGSKEDQKLASYRIKSFNYTFEKFVKLLKNTKITRKKESDISEVLFKIVEHTVTISNPKMRHYNESYELLSTTSIQKSEPIEMREFFGGRTANWFPYVNDWFLYRKIYKKIKDKVFQELEDWDSESNKIIAICGAGGSGKSVTCRKLAYDIYINKQLPVLLPRIGGEAIDAKLLDAIYEEFKIEIKKNIQDGKALIVESPKLVLLIDDGAYSLRRMQYILNSLTSKGKRILIIVFTRTDELSFSREYFNISLTSENILTLPDKISIEEQKNLLKQLEKLNISAPDLTYFSKSIESKSFFSTIYYHNYLCRDTLENSVIREYEEQNPQVQKVYEYLCAVGRFGVYLNIGLLARLVKLSISEFVDKVIKKAASDIVVEYPSQENEFLYGPRSRTVAEIIMNKKFPHVSDQLQLIYEIVNNSIPGYNVEEVNLTVLLLERILSPMTTIFSLDDKRSIVEIYMTKGFKDRAVIHHYALLELDEATKNTYQISEDGLEKAEIMLTKALDIPIQDTDISRFESNQNIYTSLGVLYSWRSQLFESNNQPALADKASEKAERYFYKGLEGMLSNQHAYHAMANMYYHRMNRTKDSLAKANLLSKSIDIINQGKSVLSDANQEILFELESRILAKCCKEKELSAALDVLAQKYKNPKGHYIKALFKFKDINNDRKLNYKYISELYNVRDILLDGLNLNNEDVNCLTLLAKVEEEINPSNLEKVYEVLLKLCSISTQIPNLRAYFDLLRISLLLKYYIKAREAINILRNNSYDHPLRFMRYILKDTNGKPIIYEGVVSRFESSMEGFIYSDELKEFSTSILFFIPRQSFTVKKGQNVKFKLGIRYHFPIAVDLELIK